MLILNPITVIVAGVALLVFGTHPVVTLIGFALVAIPATALVIRSINSK